MSTEIEWFEITQDQFTNMLSLWVQDFVNAGQHRYEESSKHHVVYSKNNDAEYGLRTTFDPETNTTTYHATLTAIALHE